MFFYKGFMTRMQIMDRTASDWLCTNRRAVPLSPSASARMDRLGTSLTNMGKRGRVWRQSWVRYRIALSDLGGEPEEVVLEPMSERFIESLRHEKHNAEDNRIRTAIRFWEGGLKNAYLWIEHGEPLCMQWLLHPRDCQSLPKLGNWSGMFPPIPKDCGVVDNIYSFVGPRQQKPGAATRLALAVMHEAKRSGLRELRTHIAQENLPAHRWARRIGLNAYGVIDRYSIKLPKVPVTYAYHHQSCEMHHLRPRHRRTG
jgi:hypothetical protein